MLYTEAGREEERKRERIKTENKQQQQQHRPGKAISIILLVESNARNWMHTTFQSEMNLC